MSQKSALKPTAPAFTPTLGRKDPRSVSPPRSAEVTPSPQSKARRDSLLKFSWPPSLVSSIPYNSNKSLFTNEEKTLIKGLCQAGQTHLFDDWDALGKCDAEKKAFIAQLMTLNSAYPGGIVKYCFTAQRLLSDAAKVCVSEYDGLCVLWCVMCVMRYRACGTC